MSLEVDNKALTQRIYDEVFSAGKIDVVDELVAEDVVEHEEFPGIPPGREGMKQFVRMIKDGFPDLSFTPQDVIAAGDRVVARVRITGTHRGEFIGIAATNKNVDVQAIDILRLENGKVVEHWGVTDQLAMMQQLGVVPQEPSP